MIITSPKNEQLKRVIDLKEKKERDRTGLTRVEGYEEISFALSCGYKPLEVFCSPALTPHSEFLIKLESDEIMLTEVSPEVFTKISYREGADGWLAIFRIPTKKLEELVLPKDPLVVIVNSVEKPGNLGAILRTAEAAGVSAVISADPVTDWGNPNIVRASKGTLFSLQTASGKSSDVISFLKNKGLRFVITTPYATKAYTNSNLKGSVAIVLGSEKYGVKDSWNKTGGELVKIPMLGKIDSLNVSTAAAILIFEALRQRNIDL